MSNTKFYKELYRYLDREDVGKWGWVNLSDEKYKNIDLELSNGRRSDEDESYTSEEKEYYPLRLKLRLKRLLYSYVKASESYWKAHNYKNKIEPRLKKMEAVCDAVQALFSLVARLYDTRGRGAAKVVDRNDRLVLTLDPCGAVVGIITTYALWLYG